MEVGWDPWGTTCLPALSLSSQHLPLAIDRDKHREEEALVPLRMAPVMALFMRDVNTSVVTALLLFYFKKEVRHAEGVNMETFFPR